MKNEKKNLKNPLSFKEALILGVNFVWMLLVYYGSIYYCDHTGSILPYQLCTGIYCAAAIILVAFSAVFSGKFVSRKIDEEKTANKKALSRKLILWSLPLIAVLLIDILDLFVVEYIKQLISVGRV